MREIPRWWQQPHYPETQGDRQSVAVIQACFGLQAFPSAHQVAKPWDPAVKSGPLTPWQCAACERTLQCCKESEGAVQRTISLVQDRRVGAVCSSSDGSFVSPHSKKRGADCSSNEETCDSQAKRHAGGTPPDTPRELRGGTRDDEQQEVQEVQDLIDRWLEASLLDEATSDRLLSALFRCDAALLRAWRCNKTHADDTLLRRLLLALPTK